MQVAVKQEAELYEPIKAYYEQRGYVVRSEVLHCDLVAVRPSEDETVDETVIVEMKKTFNLALLLQGIERLRISDRVVLAVERNRKKSGAHNQRFGDLAELCRMLGLGLMTVTMFKTKPPRVEMLCEPGEPPLRGARPARKARLLNEFRERSGDYNVGGSAKRKLVTVYRERALRCAWALAAYGPLSPSQVAAHIDYPKAGPMLRNNYYGWFERIGRGLYRLRPAGEAALKEYADVLSEWLATKTKEESSDERQTRRSRP